jgi:transcriptional regulator with XRE-family HTH domain
MTILSENLKTIRKHLSCTQMAISQVLEVGFRTYVRYEAGERDAPVAVLVKLARLGNISLDRLLTTKITPEDLELPDSESAPKNSKNLTVITGSLEEGRLMFKGSKQDFMVTTNKNERKLINNYRKLNRQTRERFLIDIEWMLNNTKALTPRKVRAPRKTQKAKNAAMLKKVAKTITKITVKG